MSNHLVANFTNVNDKNLFNLNVFFTVNDTVSQKYDLQLPRIIVILGIQFLYSKLVFLCHSRFINIFKIGPQRWICFFFASRQCNCHMSLQSRNGPSLISRLSDTVRRTALWPVHLTGPMVLNTCTNFCLCVSGVSDVNRKRTGSRQSGGVNAGRQSYTKPHCAWVTGHWTLRTIRQK